MQNQDKNTATPPCQKAATRKEAFTAAERKFGCYIRDYFVRKTRDQQFADEIWQAFWVHVYQHFPVDQMSNLTRLRHKAFQILTDCQRRRNTRERFIELPGVLPDYAEDRSSGMPQTPAEEEQRTRDFWELFPGIELTDLQKRAFFMKHRDGYTLEEISEELNTPLSTIHDWLKTTIAKCKEHYTP